MKAKFNNLITFIIISSILLVTIGISIGVFFNKPVPTIIYVPSHPIILDNSINESMHTSSKKFVDKYHEEQYNYVSPLSYDESGYQQLFDTLYGNGTKVISISGDPTELSAVKESLNIYPDRKATYLDDTSWAANNYENIISVKFLANQASFIEGILSSIYAYTYFDDVANWNLGTWGGMQLLTVIQLLSGFEQGINWFNYQVLGTDLYGKEIDPSKSPAGLEPSLMLAPGKEINLINYKGKTLDYSQKAINSNETYFSNSFIIGEGAPYVTGLINNNAKIIFPIAGGQSIDALDLIRKEATTNNPIKYIGVDTDSKKVYPDYQDLVLSSSTKETSLANYYSLWYALEKYQDEYSSDYDGAKNNPFDFLEEFSIKKDSKGWRYDEASNFSLPKNSTSLAYGDQFIGSYNNGGVEATGIEGNDQTINEMWTKFITKVGGIFSSQGKDNPLKDLSIKQFIDYAMAQQSFVSNDAINSIENFSNSFLIGSNDKPVEEVVKNTIPGMLWIPDWSNY